MPLNQQQRFHFATMWHHASFHQSTENDLLRLQQMLQQSLHDLTRLRSNHGATSHFELKSYTDMKTLVTLYPMGRTPDFFGTIFCHELFLSQTFTADVQHLLYRKCIEGLPSIIQLARNGHAMTVSRTTIKKILTETLSTIIPQFHRGYFHPSMPGFETNIYANQYFDVLRSEIKLNIRILTRVIGDKLLYLYQDFGNFRQAYLDYFLCWIWRCQFIVTLELNMVTAQEDDLQLASGCFTMLTDALALIVDPTTASIAEQSHLASLYPAQRPYRLSYAQWDVLADKLVELKMQYNVYSNPQLELDAAAVKVTLKPGYLAIIGLRPESHTLFAARQPHPGRYRVLRSLRNSMEHAPSH